jgi:hypothetical protein
MSAFQLDAESVGAIIDRDICASSCGNDLDTAVSAGKEAVVQRLEAAVAQKMDENVGLLQQLLEKQALYEEALRTVESVKKFVQESEAAAGAGIRAGLAIRRSGNASASSPVKPTPAPAEKNGLSSSDANADASTTTAAAADIESKTVLSIAAQALAQTQSEAPSGRIGEKLAPFNPTNDDCCDQAISLFCLRTCMPMPMSMSMSRPALSGCPV